MAHEKSELTLAPKPKGALVTTKLADEKRERGWSLPPNLAPRGLSRTQAAAYIGVSPTFFDELVADRRMPKPKRLNSRTIWDIRQLDIAFDAISDDQDRNPWDGKV